jgi:hypothetical protein
MVRSVARVYGRLVPDDRKRVAIFCQNYGEAGAIDFFGPKYALPRAISGHQNYFLWGPGNATGEIMLILDHRADDSREQFRSVEDLGQIESSPWAMPWEQRLHIYLCRDFKERSARFLAETRIVAIARPLSVSSIACRVSAQIYEENFA